MKKQRRPNGYWNNPRNYEIELMRLSQKLNRTPKLIELPGRMQVGIGKGIYNTKITSYFDFLKLCGMTTERKSNGYWNNPKNIEKEYKILIENLGRVPKARELPGAAWRKIKEGKYKPRIKSYSEFVKFQGDIPKKKPNGYWDNPKNIKKEYLITKQKLKRIPKTIELPLAMLQRITQGKYNPNILNYPDFLEHQGDISRKKPDGYWNNPENIIFEYKKIKQKLRRVPKTIELAVRMVSAIQRGYYKPDIKSYLKFVKDLGDNPNIKSDDFWNNPKNYKQTYLDLKQKLGRIPKNYELPTSMQVKILDGKYSPNIRNYKQFLAAMGDLEIKSPKDLQTTLNQDKKLAQVISFAQSYGKTSEIIHALKQLFPNIFRNERKITKMFLNSKKISDALAPFERPNAGDILPVLDFVLGDLPEELRKSRDLENILYSIAVEEYQKEFNTNPLGVMNKLEKLASHEEEYIAHLMSKVKGFYQDILDFSIPGVEWKNALYKID